MNGFTDSLRTLGCHSSVRSDRQSVPRVGLSVLPSQDNQRQAPSYPRGGILGRSKEREGKGDENVTEMPEGRDVL